MERILELKELITKYDISYRKGETIVPDSIYDGLVDELIELVGEEDEFFNSSIKDEEDDAEVSTERRDKVPIPMYSADKKTSFDDFVKWTNLKKLSKSTSYVISPKYDGIAMSKEESTKKAWTKGSNKLGGLRCDDHLKYMEDITIPNCQYTFGECIISRKNFENLSDIYENGRNSASGFFRKDEVTSNLGYVEFIRYGIVNPDVEFKFKHEVFDYLNKYQKIKVPYKINTLDEMSTEYLKQVFFEFSKEYEIDGLIIEIDDLNICESFGRHKSTGNPNYMIAYKADFEELKQTTIIDIEFNISKKGIIFPVGIVSPINLDGAEVTRVSLSNCGMMKELGVSIGSLVEMKRSGMVIPLITKVLTKGEFKYPPYESYWDGVHLKCVNTEPQQIKKQLLAFFKILGVENVSEKTFDLLFDSGYTTLEDILAMSKNDFLSLDRFGERKAEKTYNEIHSKMVNVSLSKLQHASGLFDMLGSRKLVLLEHFETKPTVAEVMKIDGFSDKLANNYINSYDEFFEFVKNFPITWERTKKVEATSNELEGESFVFTGYRDKNSELEIVKRGGIISSSISKKVTYLVCKDINDTSSKLVKARELGIIILDPSNLADLLL